MRQSCIPTCCAVLAVSPLIGFSLCKMGSSPWPCSLGADGTAEACEGFGCAWCGKGQYLWAQEESLTVPAPLSMLVASGSAVGDGWGRGENVPSLPAVQSLDWETFEQYCAWQLFLAHNIPLETIIPILQHLKYKGEWACA